MPPPLPRPPAVASPFPNQAVQRRVSVQTVFGNPQPLTAATARAWLARAEKVVPPLLAPFLDRFLAHSNRNYGFLRQDAFLADLASYAQEFRTSSFSQRAILGREVCIAMSLYWLHKLTAGTGPFALEYDADADRGRILGWQHALDDNVIKLARQDKEAIKGASLMPPKDDIGVEKVSGHLRLGEGRLMFEGAMSRIRAGQLRTICADLGLLMLNNIFCPNIGDPAKFRTDMANLLGNVPTFGIFAISGPTGGHAMAFMQSGGSMRFFDPEFGQFAPPAGQWKAWLTNHLATKMPGFSTHVTIYLLRRA